jgi:hypothetical protein
MRPKWRPVRGWNVKGSGQERPLYTFSSPDYTLQYWSECGYYFAGFCWSFRAEPALYPLAKIFTVVDYMGGISGGAGDRAYAALFGVV